ncbi:MAG: Uma2 family endonuclease [Methylobacter sp.]|nr:Uma2 family endonuclease [Methylobacter sp.]MDP2099417.1 Uma2 family endonuclease [Methylobacter sp.]MDP2429922.1 Uma2 family endonuclease [Methylobacter sp.]MDP3053185.1 Uma2 family endonuclease [Methylobacter sp.]MDP3360570.1 Uma2 family endonuclease [Methylobacter sp.]
MNHANQDSVVLHWPPSLPILDYQFFDFCQVNKELRIERSASGDCEIMAPTGGATSWRNSRLITQLSIWSDLDGSGIVFDSSGGFILPNGAIRSPDVSWVKKSRLAKLTPKQKQQFLPLCPDVVIELRSPSDSMKNLQDKMREYSENGACLGWLIDPEARQILVFQGHKPPLNLDQPTFLSADEVLPGFRLALQTLWDIGF